MPTFIEEVPRLQIALATILKRYDGYEMGKHPIVCMMIKWVYERNPPKAKYSVFWDVYKVFRLFKAWDSVISN